MDLSGITYPDGYVLGDDYVNVQTVTIRGPESDVSRVASCVARASHAGAITQTEVLTTDLTLLDADGNEVVSDYIQMSSETADITVPLLKTKRVPITVDFLHVPDGFPLDELNYTLSKEDILLAGPEGAVELDGGAQRRLHRLPGYGRRGLQLQPSTCRPASSTLKGTRASPSPLTPATWPPRR